MNTGSPAPKGGTSAEYLAARLKRDAPDVAAQLAAGAFKSVRAAAIAAGIVKPLDPVTKATRAVAALPTEHIAAVVQRFQGHLDRVDATLAAAGCRGARGGDDPVDLARKALAKVPGDRVVDLVVAIVAGLDAPTFDRLWGRLARIQRKGGTTP